MALLVGDRPVHRLTVDDVYGMLDAGLLTEDDRVELLEGALVEMSPKSPAHTAIVLDLLRWLHTVSDDLVVRPGQPLSVPDSSSLPEPDIAVVRRAGDRAAHPTSALLVVEVAISSRLTDTAVKPALYASAAVPDYWVVDVAARRLEVRRDPTADGYGELRVVTAPERAQPLAVDVAPLDVGALFAGL